MSCTLCFQSTIGFIPLSLCSTLTGQSTGKIIHHVYFSTPAMKAWSGGMTFLIFLSSTRLKLSKVGTGGRKVVNMESQGCEACFLREILCYLSPHPIFLPIGCSNRVTDWQLRKTAGLRGIRFHDFEILFLGSSLDIDLKARILSALQEKMAIWPNNRIIIFPKTFVWYSKKSTYVFSSCRFSHVLCMTVCAGTTYLYQLFFPEKKLKDFWNIFSPHLIYL